MHLTPLKSLQLTQYRLADIYCGHLQEQKLRMRPTEDKALGGAVVPGQAELGHVQLHAEEFRRRHVIELAVHSVYVHPLL